MSKYAHVLIATPANETLKFAGGSFSTDDPVDVHLLDADGYKSFKESLNSNSVIVNPIETVQSQKGSPAIAG